MVCRERSGFAAVVVLLAALFALSVGTERCCRASGRHQWRPAGALADLNNVYTAHPGGCWQRVSSRCVPPVAVFATR
jgi:hypothetical protein